MAKNTISQYSKTAGSNTDIQSVNIDEGCPPSSLNNAIREIMVDLASLNDGTQSLTKLVTDELVVDGANVEGAATSAKTAAYTGGAGDDASTILCSAASADYAVALTAAATLGDGFTVTIKKSDATKFMITINPNGSETIDGLPDLKLRQEHASVTLICDGSNWHVKNHSNVAIDNNIAENTGFQVDQYAHVTRTGVGDATELLQDRWRMTPAGSASARWTYSIEDNGGANGDSKWAKLLCTTADASPGAAEGQGFGQSVLGNNSIQLLGSDNKFENCVISMDIILHKGGSSSISLPAKVPLFFATIDGTQYQYAEDVSIAAVDTWYRVSIVVPEHASANLVPGTQRSCIFGIGLYGGSSVQETSGAWATGYEPYATGTSSNLADATDNYVGITNVVLQPGQIASTYKPRPYSEEVQICQHYYYRLHRNPDDNAYFGGGYNNATTKHYFVVEFPTPMRVKPTVAINSTSGFTVTQAGTSGHASTDIALGTSSTNQAFMIVTTGASLTAGDGGLVLMNTGSDYIAWISEI